MSFSEEWADWHLTPRGWETGSQRIDGSGTEMRDPPLDRVATYRWNESDSPRNSQRWSSTTWESCDHALIAELLAEHGEAPKRL